MSFRTLFNLSVTGSITMLLEVQLKCGGGAMCPDEVLDEWYRLSNNNTVPTRFLVSEQGCEKDVAYCVTCDAVVCYHDTTFLGHKCAAAPVLLFVDFRRGVGRSSASAREALEFIIERAEDSPTRLAFWKALTLHVIHLFNEGYVSLDLFADLRYLRLLHSECLNTVDCLIRARIPESAADEDVFPERLVPHVWIRLGHEEAAAKAVEAWYERVQCAAVRDRSGIPSFEASTLRLLEQHVDAESDSPYYCTRCHQVLAHDTWPKHKCRSLLSLTFKDGAGHAGCCKTLSWVKSRATTSAAFREMWDVLTKHCVELLELNFLEPSDMQRLFARELLNEKVVDETVLSELGVQAARREWLDDS